VIHTLWNADALEAKRATSVIPIVAFAEEPLRTGLVTSLARPGGNVTGVTDQVAEVAGKRVGLLREVVPALRRLAIMTGGVTPEDVLQIGEVQAVAGALGIEVSVLEIRRTEDIALAFDTLKDRAEALYIAESTWIITANMERITTLALARRLPTISSARYWPREGALMSYGANPSAMVQRSAEIVDKILRGAKPADIPFEPVIRFELVINLKTAKTLGLTLPRTLLVAADEVFELPTIGFIGGRDWTDSSIPFLRRLGELGWVEGRNILVEFRWKDGSPEATRAFLTEFVRLKVDVIHTLWNADALEAKRATSVIPIVAYAEEPLH
jgi:putative ABC transport system substrate-binding protein